MGKHLITMTPDNMLKLLKVFSYQEPHLKPFFDTVHSVGGCQFILLHYCDISYETVYSCFDTSDI